MKPKTIIPGKRCSYCDSPASGKVGGEWCCSKHMPMMGPALPKTKSITPGKHCEVVDCGLAAAGRYKGTWLCEHHLDDEWIREDIDEEDCFDDEE